MQLVRIRSRSALLGDSPPTQAKAKKTLFEGREVGAFRFSSRLERAIVRKVGEAVGDFDMIADGDRIMTCVSGGKDSYVLLDALRVLARRSPVRFELVAVNVDQGWPAYETRAIEEHLRAEGVEYRMINASYAAIVEAKLRPGQTPCSLCSRFRRAFLYDLAPTLGANKIALGHHMDDLIETLLLNLFFSGRLASMPPKLLAEDGRNVVIRPLCYVSEDETRAQAESRKYPVVRCGCPSCGLPDQKRQVIKRLLSGLEEAHPGTKRQMLAGLRNVKPDHLLDMDLWRKLGLGMAVSVKGTPLVVPSTSGTPSTSSVSDRENPAFSVGKQVEI
ncbi:MAG: tRNA 2-thiocytidine(32) synthetase TtcA [Deltaproteobacteria bacterium]|nr:tRNA 2-thiocytidine(32) synthetase TtcA [Deltaproteobacteria bacterium]